MNFNEKNSLSMPWIESPFFYEILKKMDISEEMKKMAIKFHEDGYIILDLNLENKFIDEIIDEMKIAVNRENKRIQYEIYTYNDSPRLFEEWKHSMNIKNLCLNERIITTLEFLYGRETFPFSTINFFKASNQPLHSDSIHFNTLPNLWMSGVWIALEDTSNENGTLCIVPGSHKWGNYDYETLNLNHPDSIENGEEVNYRIYEEFIKKLVETKKAEILSVPLKKGQCLIWASNLLHGGMPTKNNNLTRYTQAIHYFYKGCKKYYHPMFSTVSEGKYAEKWCNENKNIRNFQ
jgi:ectoine hydroxylase-related dioxygenase (phytanoyl-CoA dioxygenase family)